MSSLTLNTQTHFKNKDNVQRCSNHRDIKLKSHIMKLWERVSEARLRSGVTISEQQYCFMFRNGIIEALTVLIEKYRERVALYLCGSRKVCDGIQGRNSGIRNSGVAEQYMRVMLDMCGDSETVVR